MPLWSAGVHPGSPVVIEELAIDRGRLVGQFDRGPGHHLWLRAVDFRPTLFGDSGEHLLALVLGDGVTQALAHRAPHVVHADRGQRADARVGGGGTEGEAAATAHADDADAVAVDQELVPR